MTATRTFNIVKTETVTYARSFTEAELIELGFTPDDLESVDDLNDTFASSMPRYAAPHARLEESVENHGDVDGHTWHATLVATQPGPADELEHPHDFGYYEEN